MQLIAPKQTTDAEQFDPIALILISSVASLISLIATGCLLGVRNDLYLLPIAGALYDYPQFAHDLFIQSLRYYASGPWLILGGVARYVNVAWLFLGLGYLSRFLAFLGFLACADLLGVRARGDRALLAFCLCVTSLLRGQSFAGDGGLFINYFTQSEIGNGLTLLLLYFIIRRSVVTALVLEGLVFFDNAFIGAWDAMIIFAVMCYSISSGKANLRALFPRIVLGLVLAGLISAPVILSILESPDFGKHFDFDYVDFLEQFWPYHFIFHDIPITDKINFLFMLALGGAAFAILGREARPFLAACAGLLVLYGLGIVAPHFAHASIILNLHLLRDSTILQLLSVLAALSLAIRWWSSDSRIYSGVLGPALVILLCLPIRTTTIQPAFHLALALGLILLSIHLITLIQIPAWIINRRGTVRAGALILITTGFVVVVANNIANNAQAKAWVAEWEAAGNWARSHTSEDATFLLPTWYFRGRVGRTIPGSVEDDAVLNSGIFEYTAQRAVWIDFRDGAAVMWSPSYYHQWYQRVYEVNHLASNAQELSYARNHGINYVINVCARGSGEKVLFSTGRLCVIGVLTKPETS